jgi:hypothetical protein
MIMAKRRLGMAHQIRRKIMLRPGNSSGDRVDRRTGPVVGTGAGYLNRPRNYSASHRSVTPQGGPARPPPFDSQLLK